MKPNLLSDEHRRELTRIVHSLRSRRREEADRTRFGERPPPHVGGYGVSRFLNGSNSVKVYAGR
jgi:hypothetical protein